MAIGTARRRWAGARVAAVASACAMVGLRTYGQMPIGSVSTLDATVTGASSIANDRAQLGTNGTILAKDHVAYVQLIRGGSIKVCATSGVHLTAGTPSPAAAGPTPATAGAVPSDPVAGGATPAAAGIASGSENGAATWAANMPPPLMVALDRGAMELRMGAIPGDIVMTPDLRFSFNGDGQLDVHIRVTRNGDTCVENRVSGLSGHPALKVGSLFGNETYDVLPGQHVLFEGGNLREVVDNESSPCGCPEASVKTPTLDISDLSVKKAPKPANIPAAVQHPFPADVSQGLAPPPPVPQAPPQVTHTQIATTLVYNPAPNDAQTKKDDAAKAAAPVEKKGFFHSVGRFFKRIF